MKQISYPTHLTARNATFATRSEAVLGTEIVRTDAAELDYAGTVMTQVDPERKTVATVGREFHTFVIGETGCGKTRRVILPTIRLTAKTRRSMVIADPKGEIYKYTGAALKNKGYDVVVLNLRNPSRSVRWNPLEIIDRLYHSDSAKDRDQAVIDLQDLAETLSGRIHSEEDSFWEVEAAKIFTGAALLILEGSPRGSLTFENIALMARALADSKERRFPSLDSGADNPSKILSELPKNSPVASCFTGYLAAANDTWRSVQAVFEGLIGLYVTQSSLLDLFCRSEFDIEDIGKKPTALFLIVPDDTAVLYPIATVMVKQVYSTLIRLADSKISGRLDNEVSFILDEFANFAPFKDVASMLTASRSRGMTFTLVCQSMEQLQMKYDRKEKGVSEILMSNCRVWLYMNSRNLQFLERLTKLLGEYVSPYGGEKRQLVSLNDLQRLRMGEVLMLYDRNKPAFCYLPDYSGYDFGEPAAEAEFPPRHGDARRFVVDPGRVFSTVKRRCGGQPEQGPREERARETEQTPPDDDDRRARIFAELRRRELEREQRKDGKPEED